MSSGFPQEPIGGLLRPLDEADGPALAAALADPDLASWVERPTGNALENARLLIADHLRPRRGRAAAFVASDADTGQVTALVAAQAPDDPEVAEIGVWVAPAARGQGLATEVTRLLADWLLEHGVARVWIEIEPGHVASHRIAEKSGFRREGKLRAHCRDRRTGARRDCVVYSIVRADRD